MPLQLRHARIHGHDVRYRMAGKGPVILLIHGMAGSSRTWREVMKILARDHTVIAPDLLGHGESAKPMGDYSLGAYASGLRDLLVGTLGIESATLVGQSLGGGVAMQLAYQHPELCQRLVLVASGGLGREVSWVLRALTLPGAEYVIPPLFPRFARRAGEKVMRFFRDRGVRAPHIAEMWNAYASLTETPNRHAFIRTVRAVIDPGGQTVSARDRLYLAAHIPTMIVWGDRDDIIPVAHAHATHELLPQSRLEIFEGAGHFLHVEHPLRFAELLRDFVETTQPAQRDTSTLREMLQARAS
ncbi:MAG: alpha/beta fold hydrolase [Myxococcota bacterium]|jgi:pimeloyl-ACP methyl ester carboxylesterase|nr:alpha/beta fold hydrolase [Myxococcota bacterium]